MTSDDDSSDLESDSDQSITTLRTGVKPNITPASDMTSLTALKTRLQAFLPQLRDANRDTTAEMASGQRGTMEDVDYDEEYIEMNLGLGVLKGKKEISYDVDDTSTSSESESSDDEVDVMGKLMGQGRRRAAEGIEEMEV